MTSTRHTKYHPWASPVTNGLWQIIHIPNSSSGYSLKDISYIIGGYIGNEFSSIPSIITGSPGCR
jgi:hypothetical protein